MMIHYADIVTDALLLIHLHRVMHLREKVDMTVLVIFCFLVVSLVFTELANIRVLLRSKMFSGVRSWKRLFLVSLFPLVPGRQSLSWSIWPRTKRTSFVLRILLLPG